MRIQKWKSFHPEAIYPIQEVVRLVQYEQDVLSGVFRPTPLVGGARPPPYGRCLDPIDLTPDDDESDDDWDEPLYESPADFYRTIPHAQRSEQMELSIKRDELRKAELGIIEYGRGSYPHTKLSNGVFTYRFSFW